VNSSSVSEIPDTLALIKLVTPIIGGGETKCKTPALHLASDAENNFPLICREE
jgi:hypothetical protein